MSSTADTAFVSRPVLPRRVSHAASSRTCPAMSLTRRKALQLAAVTIAAPSTSKALAAMYSADTKAESFSTDGDPNKVETYMPQIEAGYKALVDLERDWEAKTKNYDGDVVRRVLGTVGVKSPLFNIRKPFLKSWQIISQQSSDFDLIERLEGEWNDVINGISSVDFQLYSVSFTELQESKESLIRQGKRALDDTIGIYADLLKDLRSAI